MAVAAASMSLGADVLEQRDDCDEFHGVLVPRIFVEEIGSLKTDNSNKLPCGSCCMIKENAYAFQGGVNVAR